MTADDAIDVNSGFKQFVIAVDSYAATDGSFMTVDDFSTMHCNFCYISG